MPELDPILPDDGLPEDQSEDLLGELYALPREVNDWINLVERNFYKPTE